MGRAIPATVANVLLAQHVWIEFASEKLIDRKLRDNESFFKQYENRPEKWFKNFFRKALMHYADYNNTYVFKKNEVMQCFASGADYLMILGATQYEDDAPFKEGMKTAIIAGCMPDGSGGFETVDKNPVGFEHPPTKYKPKVPELAAKFRNDIANVLAKLEAKDANISDIKNDLKKIVNADIISEMPDKIEIVEEKT